jgi:hypothetical protein
MIRLSNLIVIAALLLSTACSKSEPNNQTHDVAEDKSAVTVLRKPPDIQRKELNVPWRPGLRAEGAHTRWFFHCYTKFDYTLEQKQVSGASTTVSIKITKVNMNIELPIVMWIPKRCPQKVVDHEQGHVRICTRIYDGAENAARDAATRVVGMKIEGHGDTAESACAEAVNKAAETVCEDYRKNTVEIADCISKIYDDLTAQGNASASVDKTIDDAFNRFLK